MKNYLFTLSKKLYRVKSNIKKTSRKLQDTVKYYVEGTYITTTETSSAGK